MVNVGKYTIHGSSGVLYRHFEHVYFIDIICTWGPLFESPRTVSFPHFNPAWSIMEHAEKKTVIFRVGLKVGLRKLKTCWLGVFFAKNQRK